MADDRKIVIEILNASADGSEENSAETKKDADDLVKILQDPLSKNKKARKDKGEIVGAYVKKQAAKLTMSALKNTFDTYNNLRDDYLMENSMNAFHSLANVGETMFNSILGGAMIGMPGLGAVVGAVSIGVNERNRRMNYYQNLNATNVQDDFYRRKAGLIDGGRGTQN